MNHGTRASGATIGAASRTGREKAGRFTEMRGGALPLPFPLTYPWLLDRVVRDDARLGLSHHGPAIRAAAAALRAGQSETVRPRLRSLLRAVRDDGYALESACLYLILAGPRPTPTQLRRAFRACALAGTKGALLLLYTLNALLARNPGGREGGREGREAAEAGRRLWGTAVALALGQGYGDAVVGLLARMPQILGRVLAMRFRAARQERCGDGSGAAAARAKGSVPDPARSHI